MVKADLTRDYYSDLEIAPGANISEIKRQFKKLALTYHPDRNPGRENEVTAKFQKIQSAHEVLIDAQERAKYDANRIRGASRYGGMSSGVRGNPWANAASQYPPPPKAPTARQQPPPPPSSGARRYEKFATSNPSAYQSSQEGPQARKESYEAWEKVRHQKSSSGDGATGPGKSWKAPQPPPRGTPQSGREESNARRHAPPYRAGPGFEEFRAGDRSQQRSHSTNTANRKGFMPNTPGGGDEPPAPMGAYFTERNKAPVPPEAPPREPREHFPPEPPMRERPQSSKPLPNPLKQFQDKAMGNEPRISTPYATHGGEKLNPFESAHINRSKSTRERHDRFENDPIPRTGSDSNLNSPPRARPFAQHRSPRAHRPESGETVNLDPSTEDSSSDGSVQRNTPSRAPWTNGATNGATNAATQGTPAQEPTASRQPDSSKNREPQPQYRMPKAKAEEAPFSNSTPDRQPPQSTYPQTQPPPQATQTNGESMYAYSSYSSNPDRQRVPNFSVKLPTVSETIRSDGDAPKWKEHSNFFSGGGLVTPPSGLATSPQSLNAFEGLQRNLVDQLLRNKRTGSFSIEKPNPSPGSADDATRIGSGSQGWRTDPHYHHQMTDAWAEYRDAKTPTSPSKKPKSLKHLYTFHPFDTERSRRYWEEFNKIKNNQANHPQRTSSFSFNINDETFNRTKPQPNGFSNSAENISTKFTPEDWDGKFEAGSDYFKPDVKSRTQSASRPRGRSPVKVRPADAKFGQPRVESEPPIESPGGTKFSSEEWCETFKPQTFMPTTINPPPHTATTPSRKRTGPTLRATMATAAVVDNSETSDDNPLFAGRKNIHSMASSPEPMDVDTPPTHNTVPQYANTPNGHLEVNTEPLKGGISRSSSPTDTEGLRVNFDDLNIQDLMSTLALPTPPKAPQLLSAVNEYERPTRASYEDYIKRYEKYMGEWDIFNSRYLLHMVARRRQNDTLKDKRWTDPEATEFYRLGLKEDQAVLKRWGEMHEMHEHVVKAFVVMREQMKTREEREGIAAAAAVTTNKVRPRKKTH